MSIQRQDTEAGAQPASQSGYVVDLPVKGYEAAEPLESYSRYSNHIHRRFRAFVGALANEYDLDGTTGRSRYSRSQSQSVTVYNNERARMLDEDLYGDDSSVLLVFPDHTRMFVGTDSTATHTGLFGFVVADSDPVAAPVTCQDALDLLKPTGVKRRAVAGDEPVRQGEWFLLPAADEPVSDVYKPGVASRPYGASPLDNHVPREYAFGATESAFMDAFESAVPEREGAFDSVPSVVEWVTKQHRFDDVDEIEIPDHVPTLEELREWAGGVYVRGSMRHRENDHYMENVGDEWHVARTHSMEVHTADIAPDAPLSARVD